MTTPAQRLSRYRHTPARTPGWASFRHVYRPRRPTTTPLYPVVQHHLETFLVQAAETEPIGYGVPSWVGPGNWAAAYRWVCRSEA